MFEQDAACLVVLETHTHNAGGLTWLWCWRWARSAVNEQAGHWLTERGDAR